MTDSLGLKVTLALREDYQIRVKVKVVNMIDDRSKVTHWVHPE